METPTPQNTLPEIPLDELSDATKNFLLAHSAGGKSVAEVIRETLDSAALRPPLPHKAA